MGISLSRKNRANAKLFSSNFILAMNAKEPAMLTITTNKPTYCAICGYYLTSNERYVGQRCLDPGHWQAAGKLASTDYYVMARLTALSHSEPDHRLEAPQYGPAPRPVHQLVIHAGWQRPVSQTHISWLPMFNRTPAQFLTKPLPRVSARGYSGKILMLLSDIYYEGRRLTS